MHIKELRIIDNIITQGVKAESFKISESYPLGFDQGHFNLTPMTCFTALVDSKICSFSSLGSDLVY